MLHCWWCVLCREALQPRKVNNQSGVDKGMEADAAGKGGKKKNNGVSETFIVKQRVLGSWLLLGLLQEQTSLCSPGRVGIGFPCQSGADALGHGECEQKGKFALHLREWRGKKYPNTHTKNGGIDTCGEVAAKLAGWSRGLVGMNGQHCPAGGGCPLGAIGAGQ